jgi:hypothetical protein
MDSTSPADNRREYNHNYWKLWGGRKLPKAELVYVSQIVILYIIIICALVNLTLNRGESALWISLLSLCIGVRIINFLLTILIFNILPI